MVLKCLECDKLLSSIEMAEFHSTKTSHDQFEETEEEVCIDFTPFTFCWMVEAFELLTILIIIIHENNNLFHSILSFY